MAETTALGIVGLGKMGANLALNARDHTLTTVGFDPAGLPKALAEAGVLGVDGPTGFAEALTPPRVVFIYVPAGPAVDRVLDDLAAALEPGDILVDGGNSYWGDSLRRYRRLADRGLGFVDLGTSGGIDGARRGACFMAGGETETVARVAPILRHLAVEGGYVHAGPPGAGHFVKLVHNGIEFGMLQAIAEGVQLLESYPQALPTAEVLECWRHGSVIRSWLVDLMQQAYADTGGLQPVPPYVEDTGEVNWLVDDALKLEIPVPVIAQSVMQLVASRRADQPWARAIAMMRHGFGGHPYGADAGIARERREGRVGGFILPDNDESGD